MIVLSETWLSADTDVDDELEGNEMFCVNSTNKRGAVDTDSKH